jgi:glutaminyl-tRNA synthetase
VCHQTKAEIEASREAGAPSPWRERGVAENLALFEDMRRGLYAEGAATLRMKMDHRNENPNMWDSVAYRCGKRETRERTEVDCWRRARVPPFPVK